LLVVARWRSFLTSAPTLTAWFYGWIRFGLALWSGSLAPAVTALLCYMLRWSWCLAALVCVRYWYRYSCLGSGLVLVAT